MKLQPARQQGTLGSVLMVTLFAAVLLGLTLGSYLYLVHAQNISVFRSQAWNAALAMAEAGVEEALAHLNLGVTTPPARDAHGWSLGADNMYHLPNAPRRLANGHYDVAISSETFPVIYATGYVQVPAISATVSRVVQVKTTNSPLFTAALVTKHNIDLSGYSLAFDSFDSTDLTHSDNGWYPFAYPTRIRTNGNVASVSGLLDVDFPDVMLPSVTWLPPPAGGTINGTNYEHIFGTDGNYKVRDIRNKIYIGTNATVNIWLYDDHFTVVGGDAVIRIAPVGASLKIYMTGASFSMQGQGVANESGYATNFYYFGLPGNTNVSWGSNSNFIGAIYAPQAALSLGNGGGGAADFIGASIAKSVTLNGQFKFHFDENLTRQGPVRGYLATSWKEL